METDQDAIYRSRMQFRAVVRADRETEMPHTTGLLRAEEKKARTRYYNFEMSKAEFLHFHRGWREVVHRMSVQDSFENHALCWEYHGMDAAGLSLQCPNEDHTQRMQRAGNKEPKQRWGHDFWELANKSVPFYVLPTRKYKSAPASLRRSLCDYLYAKWFRPYKSELEFNQYITKLVVPMNIYSDGLGRPSAEALYELREITRGLASYVMLCKRELAKKLFERAPIERYDNPKNDHRFVHHGNCWEPGLRGYEWQFSTHHITQERFTRHYSRSPLFGTIGIALCVENWADEKNDSYTIGKIPVCLFLTGHGQSELSAPISFDTIDDDKIQAVINQGPKKAIQTTLDTAVDFVIDLERREELAASDSSDKTNYPRPKFPEAYEKLFEGDSILTQPSSKWVDTEVYKEWSGVGLLLDTQEAGFEKDGGLTVVCQLITDE